MSSKDEGISTAPSSEGSGPDTWVVRNTFLELSEREVGDASHRAASDPGLRRSKQEPEAKVEEQDPAPDWSQVALLEAERRELAEELAKVHVPEEFNLSRLEEELADLRDREDAANTSLCAAQQGLQRMQQVAGARQAQLSEEYAAKMEENQELEEECARLQEEVAAAKADMASAKRKAPRAKGRAAPPAPPAPPAPSPAMLEAHRRRTEALLALSEARVAASRAATDADEAEQAAEQLGVELEEKEEQMKAAVAQAEQSLAAEEVHFVDQLQAVDDQLQHMGRCRKDLQHRCAVRKGILDKCRIRSEQMASKVARAEGRALAMQADAEMESQELHHLKDCVEQFKGVDGTRAASQLHAAVRLRAVTRFLLLLALILLVASFGF